jgi:outer membrane protein
MTTHTLHAGAGKLLCAGALFFTLIAAASGQTILGSGVYARPQYEGAKDYRTRPYAVLDYRQGSFFITAQDDLPAAGAKVRLSDTWQAGTYLGLKAGRKANERLKGLDDIDSHGVIGGFLEWKPGRWSLALDLRQAARSGYGATAALRPSYTVWEDAGNRLWVGGAVVWSSHDDMETNFGISAAEARRSRDKLPAFSASSGFKSGSTYVAWQHHINKQWSTYSTIGAKTLWGDARKSPISQRDTSAFAGLGLLYAF